MRYLILAFVTGQKAHQNGVEAQLQQEIYLLFRHAQKGATAADTLGHTFLIEM